MTDFVPSGGDPVLDALRAEITRLENLDVVSGLTRIEREELARVRLHLQNEEKSAGVAQSTFSQEVNVPEVAPAESAPESTPEPGVEPVPEVPAPSEDQAPPQ